jgi:hypothetical protein
VKLNPGLPRKIQHSTVRKFFHQLKGLKFKEETSWSIALYGADTWTLRKVDQKYLESFEM